MSKSTGVLPIQDIKAMLEAGKVIPQEVPEGNIQPASVDLRVAESEIVRLPGIFMPGMADIDAYAREMSSRANLYTTPISEKGFVLEMGVPYLLPVEESLDLPSTVGARANNKSSSGRINLQARLACNSYPEYDSVPCGYTGPIYLIAVAKSFPVRIRAGQTFNQLRFASGPMEDSRLAPYQLEVEHDRNGLVFDLNGRKIPWKKVKLTGSSIVLTANLQTDPVAFAAKRSNQSCLNFHDRNVDPLEFFEPIPRSKTGGISLSRGGFYILSTNEAFSVPPHLCSEMVAYSTGMGEFRSHFAGFFDPGWGYNKGLKGAPAVLEVIPHEDILLEHGDPICAMELYEMTAVPEVIYGDADNNYLRQNGPRLSKHFAIDS